MGTARPGWPTARVGAVVALVCTLGAGGAPLGAQRPPPVASPTPKTEMQPGATPPTNITVTLKHEGEAKPWYRDFAVIAAIVGWVSALAQLLWNSAQQRRERM